MEINSIESAEAKKVISEVLKTDAIPFIGAGFSTGLPARECTVPSVSQLISLMASQIITHDKKFHGKESFLRENNLKKISNYWRKSVPEEKCSNLLYKYFTNVRVSTLCSQFLNLNWRHIITLNIDDAIENATTAYKKVVCNQKYRNRLFEDRLIIKLHGDAYEECTVEDGSSKIIFSLSEYMNSVELNKDLLSFLSTIWSESNLLFIGTSLSDEDDIFHTLQSANKPQGNLKRIVFQKNSDLTEERMNRLELDYEITNIITVSDWDEIYTCLLSLFPRFELSQDSIYESLKFDSFPTLPSNTVSCIKHLIREVDFLKQNATYERLIPPYLIRRSIFSEVATSISLNIITLIEGRRFSGQTSLLKAIASQFVKDSVLFIPSDIKLNLATLNNLLQIKKTIFIFDSRSLTAEDLFVILKSINTLTNNDSRVLIAASTSENYLTTPIIDKFPDINCIFYLRDNLNELETTSINKSFEQIGLLKWHGQRKLIENIFHISQTYTQYTSSIFPRNIKLSSNEMHALIILFLNDKLFGHDLKLIGLNSTETDDFIAKCSPMIELARNNYEPTSMGYKKIIINCKPWIVSLFAAEVKRTNIDEVLDLYSALILKMVDTSLSTSIFSALRVDTIRILFPKHFRELTNNLYESLRPVLSSLPDFWLQWAKGLLYTKENLADMERALSYAQKAFADGRDKTALNSQYTIALIYGKMCQLEQFGNMDRNIEAVQKYANVIKIRNKNARYVNSLLKEENISARTLTELIRYVQSHLTAGVLKIKVEFELLLNFTSQMKQTD
ncbi:MAG TPA: hypothetical protein DCO75_08025 [Fibrobacteres bacterium]|nr:hypothetical protein [Fibrobacterota bacterium]